MICHIKEFVILSEAKDLLSLAAGKKKEVLRFAQDDNPKLK